MGKTYISIPETMRRTGLSRPTIEQAVHRRHGAIEHIIDGKRIKIRADKVDKYFERMEA